MSDEQQDYEVKFETDVDYIVKYFEALDAFCDNGALLCDGEKLFTKIRDGANVALTVSKIEKGGFIELESLASGLSKHGVDFNEVLDFFKGIKGSSSVVMKYPVNRKNRTFIHIDIIDEDVQFYCPLKSLNAVSDTPDIDPVKTNTQINIPGSDLKSAITHCLKVETDQNKAIELKTSGNQFILESEDQVNGAVRKTFEAGGPSQDADLGNKSTTISMDYLDDIKNIIGGANEVTIHIDDDYPVRIDAPIDDEGYAKIIYIISPRISND